MYKHILVPLDGSDLAEVVLPHVEAAAKAYKAETVTFVRVPETVNITSSGMIPANKWDKDERDKQLVAESYLQIATSQLNYGETVIKREVLQSDGAAETIVEYAAENHIDLIIIATHGRTGIVRVVWGSVAEKILKTSCVPVLMVRVPGCIIT